MAKSKFEIIQSAMKEARKIAYDRENRLRTVFEGIYNSAYKRGRDDTTEETVKEYLKIRGYCPTCRYSSDSRGDNTTGCPIEEHFALPMDGYCHLYKPKEET